MNASAAEVSQIRIISAESFTRGARGTELPRRPYPGLRPFTLEEWPIFFGREVMTEGVLGRMLKDHVVVVHGSSGCGKSSLVYAGVLPQLARRVGRKKGLLRIVQMRPGQAPLRTMATALATGCGIDDVDALHRIVGMGAEGARELQNRLAEAGGCRVCVFVDQFEELFRFAREGSAAEAALFADFLVGLIRPDPEEEEWDDSPKAGKSGKGEATTAAPVRLIITMRSEFLGDCARYAGLAELINRSQYLLPAMTRSDLARAVREPANLFDAEVEPALAARLVEEALCEADPLPLMQHALMRLWNEYGAAMTLANYEALVARDTEERGARRGLSRLLASHANEVLKQVADLEDPVAELLFRTLTDIDAEGRGTRRPQQLGQLLNMVDAEDRPTLLKIIDGFRGEDASFLRPFESEAVSPLGNEEMIDISHEALLRAWPRIADAGIEADTGQPYGWLHREFEDGLIWRALAVQARLFKLDPTACLDSATTDRRDQWYDQFGSRPAWAERHLIDRRNVLPEEQPEWLAVADLMAASRRERARNRRRWLIVRIAAGAFVAALVLALAFWILVISRERDASNEQLKKVEAFEQKAADASRASYGVGTTAPAVAPLPSATDEGEASPVSIAGAEETFVWIGSDRTAVLLDRNSKGPVRPRAARVGETYATNDWLVARFGPPAEGYVLAGGSGYVRKGALLTIKEKPTRHAPDNYWARVRARVVPFATVFIQFAGSADEAVMDETQEQLESRNRAKLLATGLQRLGYKVPPEDREAGALGLSEVRYFHRADKEQADILAASINKMRFPKSRVKVVNSSRNARKPPPGTLELWIDVNPRPAS